MQLHELTPTQLEWHRAHEARKARLSPKPVPAIAALVVAVQVAKPEPVSNVIPLPVSPRVDECWIDVTIWPPIRGTYRKRDGCPTIKRIQLEVCAYYDVTRIDLLSARRTADIVRPRQVAGYLAKIMTGNSYPEIGRRFGGRDHSTQICAFRKIERLLLADPDLAKVVSELKERISR